MPTEIGNRVPPEWYQQQRRPNCPGQQRAVPGWPGRCRPGWQGRRCCWYNICTLFALCWHPVGILFLFCGVSDGGSKVDRMWFMLIFIYTYIYMYIYIYLYIHGNHFYICTYTFFWRNIYIYIYIYIHVYLYLYFPIYLCVLYINSLWFVFIYQWPGFGGLNV